MSKVLTVDKIVKEYGYKVSTLKYMRDNSQANAGHTPSWYPVMNRPHYPTDQFELWHQRQINKNKKKKSVKSVKLVKSIK